MFHLVIFCNIDHKNKECCISLTPFSFVIMIIKFNLIVAYVRLLIDKDYMINSLILLHDCGNIYI